jgi:hypothetical protein
LIFKHNFGEFGKFQNFKNPAPKNGIASRKFFTKKYDHNHFQHSQKLLNNTHQAYKIQKFCELKRKLP